MLAIPFVGIALASGAVTMLGISGIIRAISSALNPFINVILKMKKNNINENTIREFTKIIIGNGENDKESASLISAIIRITKELGKVGVWTAAKSAIIAKSIRPIFETIGMFINIVGSLANMRYVSEWNEDGTPAKYEPISYPMFIMAGTTISISFRVFLEELGRGLRSLKGLSLKTIVLLGAGIGPVMRSVKNFTDAILSVLSTKIPEEFDENGKPIKWTKFSSEDFALAATMITDNFVLFLEKFSEKSKNISARSAMLIDLMKNGIGQLMNAVSTYTKTITDFVSGKQIEYTDVNTGRVIKEVFRVNPEDFTKYGETVADSFIGFIDSMYKKFEKYGYTEHHYEIESHIFKKDTVVDNSVEKNHVTDLITGFANIGEVIRAVQTFVNFIYDSSQKIGKIDLKS